MALAGLAWFAGTFGWPLTTLHRGLLVLVHLSYPSGRLPRTILARIAIALAVVDGAVPPLARNDRVTVVIAGLVVAAALRLYAGSGGVARHAAIPALLAAVAFAAILSLGATLRLTGIHVDRPVLWSYDLVIASLATILFTDLLRARWSEAVLRGLMLDLGPLPDPGSLRRRLARALDDPRLIVGIWDPETETYLNESGDPVVPPTGDAGLVATTIGDDGGRLALLVHDRAAETDPDLTAALAAVTRTAVANSALEAQVAAQAREIEASRRRLVEAADDERRSLRLTLARGPERRLRRVSELIGAGDDGGLSPLFHQELQRAIEQLRDLANGIRPAELEHGITAALHALAERSTVEVTVSASVGRLHESVEAAAYFVCAEGLANVAKHAHTQSARVHAVVSDGRLVLEVTDAGVGAANVVGSGLRGLADRVEALGGRLRIESPPGKGTRVVAEIPCSSS
jgi:hypothetical protein